MIQFTFLWTFRCNSSGLTHVIGAAGFAADSSKARSTDYMSKTSLGPKGLCMTLRHALY
jgi:hypothetical protein